jgi:hypothetical protein
LFGLSLQSAPASLSELKFPPSLRSYRFPSRRWFFPLAGTRIALTILQRTLWLSACSSGLLPPSAHSSRLSISVHCLFGSPPSGVQPAAPNTLMGSSRGRSSARAQGPDGLCCWGLWFLIRFFSFWLCVICCRLNPGSALEPPDQKFWVFMV